VPGGQAEYLRVPHADYGPIKVPKGPGDDRFLYLSDVLPTAWQAVEYAGVTAGDTLVVLGAGPIGDMASRIAVHRGIRTITVDLVAERLTRVAGAGAEAVDLDGVGKRDLGDHLREMTGGRGPDAVVDAVGMEAHGSPGMKALHKLVGLLPDAVAEPMMNTAGTDRMAALYSAFDIVRRGGTISLSGVYGGMADPIPMLTLFDKQVQLRMGQANVKRWVPDILPLLEDEDPLGVDSFATHHLPLDEAPTAYQMFQEKKDGAVKVVFRP
jgi:threonine dehydrogenase-like Zn-dependent dehydrogenase